MDRLNPILTKLKTFGNNAYASNRFINKLPHTPVLCETVNKFIKPQKCDFIVDMTFGAGGHTRKLLEESKTVKIFCLDRDPVAYSYAKELQLEYPNQVYPLLGKFSDLPNLLRPYGIRQNSIDAILFDFGCSSMQFDTGTRGFSISADGPLDMRMNQSENTPTAADVLARASEGEIAKILKIYGEEKLSRKIARAIIEMRYTFRQLKTTRELSHLVASVTGSEARLDMLGRFAHSATKTFQALRIFVNNELNEINYGIVLAEKYLKIGGVLVTLSFHSLEDTIVKRHITGNVTSNAANTLPMKFYSYSAAWDQESMEPFLSPSWMMINKHVIVPSDYEIKLNPRCRSAKLRCCVRVR